MRLPRPPWLMRRRSMAPLTGPDPLGRILLCGSSILGQRNGITSGFSGSLGIHASPSVVQKVISETHQTQHVEEEVPTICYNLYFVHTITVHGCGSKADRVSRGERLRHVNSAEREEEK